MNLIELYLQEEDNRLIINSKDLRSSQGTGLDGELLDGHHAFEAGGGGHYIMSDGDASIPMGVASFGTVGLVSDAMIGRLSNSATVRSNVASRDDLEAIEGRVATLEATGILNADIIAPLRMTPMTAVFQGSEYEITFPDGSVIRASNFQVREIRDEGSS